MESNEKSPKDNFKNAICYFPLVAVLLFFVEENKTPDLEKNIKYGIYLIILYMILSFAFSIVFILLPLLPLLSLFYVWVSIYYWYKAYNWEDIRIEFIDKIEEKRNSKKDSK